MLSGKLIKAFKDKITNISIENTIFQNINDNFDNSVKYI